MAIADIYHKLEEKWYAFLDGIDAKGVPVYNAIDPIENAGIPSFPLCAGVAIILLALVVWALMGGIGGTMLTVYVEDVSGLPIETASIVVYDEGKTFLEQGVDEDGKAVVSVPAKELQVEASSPDCDSSQTEFIDTSVTNSLTIMIACRAPAVAGCSGLSQTRLVTTLVDDNNNVPTGCVMRVYDSEETDTAVITPFKVTVDGLLDISEEGTCPNENDVASIDCDDHEYSNTVQGMYDELALFGYLTVDLKVGDDPSYDYDEADNLRNIYVKVASSTGSELEGIIVRAATADGYDLDLGFSNVELTTSTNVLGEAKLVMPDEQAFYISLEDPQGAHVPMLSENQYKATLSQSKDSITLTMKRGFKTTIVIKESSTQKIIPYAYVTVYDKATGKAIAKGRADGSGKYIVTLLEGQQYYYEVMDSGYDAISGDVIGNEDTSAYMDQIDLTLTGTLIIDVISGHGMKDAFEDVNLMLYRQDDNGTILWKECKTNNDGRCYFNYIKEGTYDLQARPPGSVTKQVVLSDMEITRENTTQYEIEVVPTQVKLTVVTMIEGEDFEGDLVDIPKQNVKVRLWDVKYQEKVAEKVSDTTRKVRFDLDYKREYFITADYIDEFGKSYGPLETDSFDLRQSKEMSIVLEELTESVSLRVLEKDGDIAPGPLGRSRIYFAELTIALPYYEGFETYDSAEIELFTGEPGTIVDLVNTPILIDPISLNDIASQDPYVESIVKADEYYFEEDPRTDDRGSSKYLKIRIGHYTTPTQYRMLIPIYVRDLAKADTNISYRATWTTNNGDEFCSKKNCLWEIVPVEINETVLAPHSLDEGDFFRYNARLLQSPGGSGLTSVPENALFYATMTADARLDTSDWEVDVEVLPKKAEAVWYEGSIARQEGGTASIPRMDVSGTEFTVRSDGKFPLKRDDSLTLTVAFRANERGSGSVVFLNDYENPLGFTVTKPAKSGNTEVSNVVATLIKTTNFCSSSSYDYYGNTKVGSTDDECWMDFSAEDELLPVNDKKFKITVQLDGVAGRTVNVRAEASDSSIKFDGSGTYFEDKSKSEDSPVRFTGKGTSTADNLMSIFIWEAGGEEPVTPWATFEYGPVDYSLKITAIDEGSVVQQVSSNTDEFQIKLNKRTASGWEVSGKDELYNNRVLVNIKNGQSYEAHKVENGETYFEFIVEETDPVRGVKNAVTFEANHRDVVTEPATAWLKETEDAVGVVFTPDYPQLLFERDFDLPDEMTEEITITSTWDKELGVKITLPSKPGVDFSAIATAYVGGTPINAYAGSNDITIPKEGSLVVKLKMETKDVTCRLDDKTATLKFVVDEMPEPVHYGVTAKCSDAVERPDETGEPLDKTSNYVVREYSMLERVNRDSCAANSDGSYAFLCDAEQLGLAIIDGSNELLGNDKATYSTYVYAVGNDMLDAKVLTEVLGAHNERFGFVEGAYGNEESAFQQSTSDVILENAVTCGLVKLRLEKTNSDEDVIVTIEDSEGETSWCKTGGANYFIGLLNVDQNLRPQFGDYYSFDASADNEKFVEAIQKAREMGSNVDVNLLFGAESRGMDAGVIIDQRTGGDAQAVISYRECEASSASACPVFALNQLRELQADDSQIAVVGYYDIDQMNDVRLGIVYDRNIITTSEETLSDYRVAFIKRMMEHWIKSGAPLDEEFGVEAEVAGLFKVVEESEELALAAGADDVWPLGQSKNRQFIYNPRADSAALSAGFVINLVGPQITVGSMYGFDADGAVNTRITSKRSVNLQVDVTDADFCMVSNVQPNGDEEEAQPFDVLEGVVVTDWELLGGSGTKRVSVYCVKDGIPSHKLRMSISLDESGMQIVSTLPDLVTTNEEYVEIPKGKPFKVRDRFSPVKYCEVRVKGEDGADVGLREICDDNNDGVHGVWDANGNWSIGSDGVDDNKATLNITYMFDEFSDGCCVVDDLGKDDLYYYISEVSCTSPYLNENEYTSVVVTCEDEQGNTADMGELQLWRWSNDAPEFEVPNDFAFSTNRLKWMDTEDVQFWFGEDARFTDGLEGPVEFYDNGADFEFAATESWDEGGTTYKNFVVDGETFTSVVTTDANSEFDYKFSAFDVDGLTPKSCEAVVEYGTCAWSDNKYGCSDYSDAMSVQCDGEQVFDGDNSEYEYTCRLPLKKDSVNKVEITCIDNSDAKAEKSEEFEVTWDESGPEIMDDFWMEQFQVVDMLNGSRLMNPVMKFSVKDAYSNVGTCHIEIDNKYYPLPTPVACGLTSLTGSGATSIGGATNAMRQEAVCQSVEGALDPSTIRFGDDTLHVYCWDALDNIYLTQPKSAGISMEDSLPDVSQVVDDVYTACKIIRDDYSSAKIQSLGFDDNPPGGSDKIVDGNTAAGQKLDETGVSLAARYKTGSGSVGISKIVDKLRDLEEKGINRAAECSTQGACDLAMIALSTLTAGEAQAQYQEAKKADAAKKEARATQLAEELKKGKFDDTKFTPEAKGDWEKLGTKRSGALDEAEGLSDDVTRTTRETGEAQTKVDDLTEQISRKEQQGVTSQRNIDQAEANLAHVEDNIKSLDETGVGKARELEKYKTNDDIIDRQADLLRSCKDADAACDMSNPITRQKQYDEIIAEANKLDAADPKRLELHQQADDIAEYNQLEAKQGLLRGKDRHQKSIANWKKQQGTYEQKYNEMLSEKEMWDSDLAGRKLNEEQATRNLDTKLDEVKGYETQMGEIAENPNSLSAEYKGAQAEFADLATWKSNIGKKSRFYNGLTRKVEGWSVFGRQIDIPIQFLQRGFVAKWGKVKLIRGTINVIQQWATMEGRYETDWYWIGVDYGCEWTINPHAKAVKDALLDTLPFADLTIPDRYESEVCSSTNSIKGGKTYFITATGKETGMGAMDNVAADVFAVCFDACDDFYCHVEIREQISPGDEYQGPEGEIPQPSYYGATGTIE